MKNQKRIEKVVEYYVLCNSLKDIVRTGWKNWNVKRDRIESVAEHIYGVQMLAIAMWSEFEYPVDLRKVLTMLAVHETEEIFIGDLTPFQITREEKTKLGHVQVQKMFSKILDAEEFKDLIFEYDERKTPEAIFASQCDKLERDLQCKLYDEQNCVDLSQQHDNSIFTNEDVNALLNNGLSWSQMWIEYNRSKNKFDENFYAISDYIYNNNIKDLGKEEQEEFEK